MSAPKLLTSGRACPVRVPPSQLRPPGPRSPFAHALRSSADRRQAKRTSVQCPAMGEIVSTEWNDDDYIEVGTLGRAHGIKGEVLVGLSTSSPDERFGRPGRRFIQAPPAQGAFVTRPPEPPREVQLIGGRQHITKGNQVWLLRFKECPDRDTAETLRNYRVLIHKTDREDLDGDDEFYSADLVGLTVALPSSHPAVSGATAASGSDSESDGEAAADGAAHGGGCGCCPPAADAAGGEAVEAAAEEEEEEDSDDDEDVVVALGEVVDVYDGTGTHGVLRIGFREGLQLMPDGQLEELSEEERQAAEASGQSTLTKTSGLLPFARELVPEVDLEDGLLVVDPPAGWLELYLTPKEKKKRKFRKRRSPKPLPVPVAAEV